MLTPPDVSLRMLCAPKGFAITITSSTTVLKLASLVCSSSTYIRQHTSAYVSIRQRTSSKHTSAYVSIMLVLHSFPSPLIINNEETTSYNFSYN